MKLRNILVALLFTIFFFLMSIYLQAGQFDNGGRMLMSVRVE